MKLDDFDAVFRSSVKDRFELAPPTIDSVLIVSDMLPSDAAALESSVKNFLASATNDDTRWRTIGEDEFKSVDELLRVVEAADGDREPDLIVCYRHLLGRQKELPHSLGSIVDTLTQVAASPVLLLPPPSRPSFDTILSELERVLVVTDHLAGDNRLANWGVKMCPPQGCLYLAHVEDSNSFEHYMEIISMIPDIDTESTQERIKTKLMGRPADYIATIAEVLAAAEITESIVPIVTMAHRVSDYKRIADEHEIQLVVMNTKDANQLAMHGMAYAISVEIQDRPLLLL